MAFTLTDLLDLPSVQQARPEIVVGHELDDVDVRWVHTSEIFEIAPLLRGGEVLVTTGLGLVASTADARRAYVRRLAQVGAAALFLELGRTFVTVPPEVAEEAARCGLPLVVLHQVVPFVAITEEAHTALLSGEREDLLRGAQVRDELVAALADSRDLIGFVGAVGAIAGEPTALYTAAGELVAGPAQDVLERAGRTAGPQDAGVRAPVVVEGQEWGTLCIFAPAAPRLETLATHASPLVALEVRRRGSLPISRFQAGSDLVVDMLTGRYESAQELTKRALGVGLNLPTGFQAVALCVRARGVVPHAVGSSVLAAARAVGARVFGPVIAGASGPDVVVGTRVRPREVRDAAATFARLLSAEIRSTSSGSALVSVGSVVADVPSLVGSMQSARDTANLATKVAPLADVVHAQDFALYRVFASLVDDSTLEDFVADQLGPLLEQDARTGSQLVATLDALFVASLSKNDAAQLLGVRRQTVYGRLERIDSLLGVSALEHRARRTAIDLALLLWRLRSAAGSGG